MPQSVVTFHRFLPFSDGPSDRVVYKNRAYFDFIFMGGNYLSGGNILQRLFGGKDEVTLFGSLRLQPDGVILSSFEEPSIVLDKRSIRPGKLINIPSQANILVKIPAHMDSIGFGFKVATTKRSDNFTLALNVLNDPSNKSVITEFIPSAVGKALGVGKIAKDIFDAIDSANNRGLIDATIYDFIIPSSSLPIQPNFLQEGYLVIFVRDEKEMPDDNDAIDLTNTNMDEFYEVEDSYGRVYKVDKSNTIFIDPFGKTIHERLIIDEPNENNDIIEFDYSKLKYDESQKLLYVDDKIVTNTYLVFKVLKSERRELNVGSSWAKKFQDSVDLLANELIKTSSKLTELLPRVSQMFAEASALLSQDGSYIQKDKEAFRLQFREKIEDEKAKYTQP